MRVKARENKESGGEGKESGEKEGQRRKEAEQNEGTKRESGKEVREMWAGRSGEEGI